VPGGSEGAAVDGHAIDGPACDGDVVRGLGGEAAKTKGGAGRGGVRVIDKGAAEGGEGGKRECVRQGR